MDWLSTATSIRITTTGRRSGEPHAVTVWFAAVRADGSDDQVARITAYAMSRHGLANDWVQNLLAEPTVTVSHRNDQRRGRARVVDDPTEHERARTAMYAKYAPSHRGLESWLTAESATVVAVELDGIVHRQVERDRNAVRRSG